jgi:hypothetical protein
MIGIFKRVSAVLGRAAARAVPTLASAKRGSHGQRARTIVGSWLVAFIACNLALAMALEGPLAEIRNPIQTARERQLAARVAEAPGRPLVLAMGSSQTLWGLRARELSDGGPLVFNFGIPAYGPVHQYAALAGLLAKGFEPAGIIVEVMPGTLSTAPFADVQYGLGFMSLRETLAQVRATGSWYAGKQWVKGRAVPWFSFRHRLLSRALPDWSAVVPVTGQPGYQTDDYGWFADPRGHEPGSAEMWRVIYQKPLHNFCVMPCNSAALRATLRACADRKIQALLVIPPEGPKFRGWYGPGTELAFREFLDVLKSEFGVGVIDARDWLASEDDFIDSVHLTRGGAAKFTDRFAVEVAPFFEQVESSQRSRSSTCGTGEGTRQ